MLEALGLLLFNHHHHYHHGLLLGLFSLSGLLAHDGLREQVPSPGYDSTMSFSLGALIWISVRPLLRLIIGTACGFIITKLDMFPPVAARGASQVILNVAAPCLLFSKIVPAFNSDNIRVFVPLLVVSSLYEVFGIILAWLVKQFFWVPHRFRNGILVAGGWGNVGDIPISVIVGITSSAPFRGVEDQNLSVAYISVYMLVFFVTLFPLGGHNWIKMDYVGPDVETCDVKAAMKIKRRKLFCMSTSPPAQLDLGVAERADSQAQTQPEMMMVLQASGGDDAAERHHMESIRRLRRIDTTNVHPECTIGTPTSELAEETVVDARSPGTSVAGNLTQVEPLTAAKAKGADDTNGPTPETISFRSQTALTRTQLWKTRCKTFISSLLSAPSIAIFLAFPIALVPELKALFIDVPTVNMPDAPDGQPPLSFIMDTATFIGDACVPLGLICLGSALARLKIPFNQWNALPLGAISSLAIGKLLLMPVVGVLMVQGMVRGGFIPKEDKVLQFVCIFTSCLPTATTQVYLTQLYSAEGDAEHLSAFLIPQYALMIFSMTALTAYTLNLIF